MEVAVFDLVVAKGGAKLYLAPKDKECVASTTLGPCHDFFGGRGRGLHAQSVSMVDLAAELTDWADRIVLDKTGLTGLYNIQTTPWTPDNPGANLRPKQEQIRKISRNFSACCRNNSAFDWKGGRSRFRSLLSIELKNLRPTTLNGQVAQKTTDS